MAKRKSRSLAAYRAKRNFDRTAEPAGGVRGGVRRARGVGAEVAEKKVAEKKEEGSGGPEGRLFVVQKHRARRLHFDFRLELDGVLKSWAVPKGPSVTAGSKPLAVQVEDHPLDYADFEGVIPAGQYGAGEVIVWDRGRWEPLIDPHKGLAKGDLKFKLHGERLRGEWALVRLRPRANERGDGKNWLLIKKRDEGATGEDILADETSVVSGRTLDDVKAGPAAKPKRKPARPAPAARDKSPRPAKGPKPRPPDPSRLKGAVRREQPASMSPQLACACTSPPAGDQWLHEIKYDGYRLLCMVRRGKVKLLTRSGQDWTGTFQPVADAVAELPLRDAVVDGEVVVLDRRGIPDFQALQNAMKTRVRSVLVYYAFDLPFASGWDLRACRLEERKALLHAVIPQAVEGNGTIRYSDHIRGRGAEVFKRAFATGLEGIVSKRADAPYESRRTDTWQKIKCRRTDEFVIGGYTDPEGSREGLGALLLARPRSDGKLVYFGKVGTGFDTAVLRDLTERLGKIERRTPGIEPPPNRADRVGVHWVEPVLVADVEYGSVTREGIIRHATYRGLRLDKPAAEVSSGPLEAPASLPDGGPAPAPVMVRPTGRPGAVMVGGVQVTNADRVVYPDADVTKLRVAEYYLAASERRLPFIIDRPLSLLRSPKGISGQAFFQRHPMESFPKSVDDVRVPGHDGRYLMIHDRDGLMSLVQFGTIEFHPWHCRADSPETPDLMTIDLDPGPGVPWEGVIAAAMAMREYLRGEAVESWVKTSGGKGLHVVSSLDGTATWDDLKAFAGRLAESISRAAPAQFTASATADRRGKIFIDHLRNRRSATSVAAYSLRARPGAAVSAPISWEELRRCPGPSAYTIKNMALRLNSPDAWKDFWTRRSALPKAR